MSAILKALKRLEQETAANAGAPLPEDVGNQSRQQAKSIVVPGMIGVILCIITGAGLAVYLKKSPEQEPAEILLQDAPPVPAVKAPAKTPSPNLAAKSVATREKKPAVAMPGVESSTAEVNLADTRQKDLQKDIRQPVDAQTHDMPADPQGLASAADPFAPLEPDPETAGEISPSLEENAEPAAALQPGIRISETIPPALTNNKFSDNSVVRKTELPVEIIEDPAIELQAISWSTDEDKRMAIISGKICREKDRVGEYVIQSINSGDVIISKGSVSGKLVFKIR